jgi:hypothetical protein
MKVLIVVQHELLSLFCCWPVSSSGAMENAETEGDFFTSTEDGSKIVGTDALMSVISMPQTNQSDPDHVAESSNGLVFLA